MMIFMKIPTKRLKNGFELPVYGLGLWEMGGRMEPDRNQDQREIAALESALKLGVSHFDTAEMYGHGHAEELLGIAMSNVPRSTLTIATKVMGANQGYAGVHRAFAASLARLKTDYVDLYMLHRYPEQGLPIADTMRAMDELLDAGVVKYIGVSNLSPNRFNAAQAASKHPLVCNQVHYNLEYREAEARGVLEQCQREDVMLVAWRPLQKGGLASAPIESELSQKYDKTPAQIALNWLISQDHVVTIAKTSQLTHLEENLGALGWTMDASDIERIRAEYPDQKTVSNAVALDYAADIAA
jgi:diketogulonate reductase-like aldo/keto reductase